MAFKGKVSELLQLKLFEGESPAVLERLLEPARERLFDKGEVLLEPDQENHHLYLILDGSVQIELEAEGRAFVTYVGRGECVGELSVLDGKPTVARVVASEQTRILTIEREEFWRLLERSHIVVRNLLRLLSGRIRKNDEALSDSFVLQQRYAQSARIDPLTGLYNRYWLDEMLPRLVERSRTDGASLGMLMLDVDHFKQFNDTYGHLAGDEVLRKLGAIIRSHLRVGDSAVRYGGEEFVIILPEISRTSVFDVAQRLCQRVSEQTQKALSIKGLPGVTVSIGISMLGSEQDGRDLIAAADAALYRAKNAGRNRVAG